MSESRPTGAEPTVIAGRYQIIKKLGAGAFGTVYQAKDTTLNRELAIKTIRLEGLAAASTDLDELLKRFKQEATAGAALKHPNIVTVYDFGQSQGLTYLAMEFVEGVGLERIIKEAGKLPIDRAASLAGQVADALGYAHQKKVIHRDIKPANIMVEAGERVKVTDFGIARVTDSGENLTQTGGLLGTPSYMSPEQAKGKKVDGRSDLFSVGCVLYELLAGQKAFSGDSITGILFKIIAEEPPPIRDLDPLIPDDIVWIVEKALAKDPDERYQTGQEMAADLFALARPGHVPTLRQADVPTAHGVAPGDTPTIATPPTAQGTISSAPTAARAATPAPGSTTSPAETSAPVAATRLIGGSGTAAAPPIPGAETPRRPTPATPRRSARPAQKSGAGRVIAIGGGAALLLVAGAVGMWMMLGRGPSTPPAETAPETAEVVAPTPAPGGGVEAPGDGEEAAAAFTESAGGGTTEAATRAEVTPPRSVPATGRRSQGGSGNVSGAGKGAGTTAAAAATAPAALPPQQPAALPPRSADNFLDDLPEAASPDGRAAGQALAQAYGSGDAPAYGSGSRFKRRPRIPRHSPPEQPAVRALAWILSAQKAHLRRTGRCGTLDELVAGGDLPLTGPRTADGFDRKGYHFTVTASGEEFRADARPLTPRGRAFYVDDNGYVLEADD